jgi:Homeodomain-like domain
MLTGYKIVRRYNDGGPEALTDRSRRPYRHANQLPVQIETLIVRLKQDKPAWGAPKIRERLRRLYPDVHTPAISTVHAMLDRHGLVQRRSPSQLYRPSPRPYAGLPELDYPLHDKTITVTTCGRICLNRQKINLNQVFAGQKVGIKQVDERIWLATFMHYDLGYFDDETCRLEPLENPFGPKVLPMSPV